MRILVISQVWEPETGTPQRRWRWLTRHLVDAGHEVSVLAPPPHYPLGRLLDNSPEYLPGSVSTGTSGETIYRCSFHEHDFSLSSRLKDQVAMAQSQMRLGHAIIKKARPDVIIATAPPLPTVYTATLLALRFRVPYIIDLRDAWPDLLEDMGAWDPRVQPGKYRDVKRILMHLAMRGGGSLFTYCLHKANAVVTTADQFSHVLKSRGVEATMTLRNLGAQRGLYLDPPDITPGPLNILYAGTTGRAQGLTNAIEALKIVRDRGVDARMRFIGTGAEEKTLKKLSKKLDVPVEFLDSIPFVQVPQHYEWAHTILVHLQDWKAFEYTVPSKLYEALELGRHITLAAAGESAHIVSDSHSGDCVTPMDPWALADLWEALDADRSRLVINGGGLEWLKAAGTPEENAERFHEFIHEVVKDAALKRSAKPRA